VTTASKPNTRVIQCRGRSSPNYEASHVTQCARPDRKRRPDASADGGREPRQQRQEPQPPSVGARQSVEGPRDQPSGASIDRSSSVTYCD
jgi:hypothetical protein